jgi:hypothetical protein
MTCVPCAQRAPLKLCATTHLSVDGLELINAVAEGGDLSGATRTRKTMGCEGYNSRISETWHIPCACDCNTAYADDPPPSQTPPISTNHQHPPHEGEVKGVEVEHQVLALHEFYNVQYMSPRVGSHEKQQIGAPWSIPSTKLTLYWSRLTSFIWPSTTAVALKAGAGLPMVGVIVAAATLNCEAGARLGLGHMAMASQVWWCLCAATQGQV